LRVLSRVATVWLFAALALAIGFATYAVLARWALHGPVHAQSLGVSMVRATGSLDDLFGDPSPCRRTARPDEWRCSVADPSFSGSLIYRVRVRPASSCWDGRLVSGTEGRYGDGTVSGCVHRWQWSLLGL
jgi:hypothetical protein